MVDDGRYERPPNVDRPVVLIPGYLLGFDFARNTLAASARANDPHVGTTSKYALARGTAARAERTQGERRGREASDEHMRHLSTIAGDRRPSESGREYAMRALGELRRGRSGRSR